MMSAEMAHSQAKEVYASWLMRFAGKKFMAEWNTVKPIMIPKKPCWNLAWLTFGTATPKETELTSPSAPGGVPSLLFDRMRRMEVSCCAIWNS